MTSTGVSPRLRVLFLHQNMPGQYKGLLNWVRSAKDVSAAAITDADNPRTDLLPTARYRLQPTGTAQRFGSVMRFEDAVARAEGAVAAALELKARGFEPDLILGHGAWGETFHMKEVFPDARLISYAEFHYRASGLNMGFDPEFETGGHRPLRSVGAKNAVLTAALAASDWGQTPTDFQASTFPPALRSMLGVVFDGIDTAWISPQAEARFVLPDGRTLTSSDRVITFVNRNLEPYRGYHVFMRALPEVLARVPDAQVVIVGGDGVSYGEPPRQGGSWKDIFLAETRDRLDLERVHFVGQVTHGALLDLYRVSSAHVYLTYPFVLSWSMIEAMAAGCVVIGSDVAPVREVLEDGVNGLLTPFFDIEALADRIVKVVLRPSDYRHLREAARAHAVARHDLASVCLPAQLRFYESVLNGRMPAGEVGWRA